MFFSLYDSYSQNTLIIQSFRTMFAILTLPAIGALTFIGSYIVDACSVVLAWIKDWTFIEICQNICKQFCIAFKYPVMITDEENNCMSITKENEILTVIAVLVLPAVGAVAMIWTIFVDASSIIVTRVKHAFVYV